jgi:hypothetical protein
LQNVKDPIFRGDEFPIITKKAFFRKTNMSIMKNKSEIKSLESGTRERLLETASHLFAEKGYASTSVR